jgi:hypothetical protein
MVAHRSDVVMSAGDGALDLSTTVIARRVNRSGEEVACAAWLLGDATKDEACHFRAGR